MRFQWRNDKMSKIPKSLKTPESQTDYLVNLIAKDFTLFHDQYQAPYLATDSNNSQLIRIDSKEFTYWVNNFVYRNFEAILKHNQVKDISNGLGALALYAREEKSLEVRTSFDGKTLRYDLGSASVKIDESGWIVEMNPPIVFKRFSSQEKQVMPERNGSVQQFREFVNIPDECDWLLFLVFMISSFIPDFPKPILVLNGSQGAGKTTPMRFLKKLVDPSILQSCDIPQKTDELARIANRHILLFFDNLSKIPNSVSDDLCRLITGDGFSKRTAYTNDEETIFVLKRAVMMNGINSFITQADLLDRSLLLEVERISEEKRVSEDILKKNFEEQRPKILGAIFDTLAKAIKIYPTVKLEKLPRMADFAKWGYAIAEALDDYSGEDFLLAYEENRKKQTDEAIQANPAAVAVTLLLDKNDSWEGTASDFFDIFDVESPLKISARYLHRNTMWPKDPSGVGRALKRAEASLKSIGILVEHKRVDNQRIIKIYKEKSKSSAEFKQESLLDGSHDTHRVIKLIDYELCGDRPSNTMPFDICEHGILPEDIDI